MVKAAAVFKKLSDIEKQNAKKVGQSKKTKEMIERFLPEEEITSKEAATPKKAEKVSKKRKWKIAADYAENPLYEKKNRERKRRMEIHNKTGVFFEPEKVLTKAEKEKEVAKKEKKEEDKKWRRMFDRDFDKQEREKEEEQRKYEKKKEKEEQERIERERIEREKTWSGWFKKQGKRVYNYFFGTEKKVVVKNKEVKIGSHTKSYLKSRSRAKNKIRGI